MITLYNNGEIEVYISSYDIRLLTLDACAGGEVALNATQAREIAATLIKAADQLDNAK